MVEHENGLVQTDRQYVWVNTAVAEEREAGTGAVTRRFFGTGEQDGGVALFCARDHLGSVRELTDGAASLRGRYHYDPWGRQTRTAGDLEAWSAFTGHPQHAPSGLALTLYRGYDAGLGLWVSEDPIGPQGDLNLYRYALARPTDAVDRLGLQSISSVGPPNDVPPGWYSNTMALRRDR